ncbi:AAA family ATPase [Thalassobacter stenotrophicus]|uniref:Regulatory protein RepA n=2 Tax=Thalassobacter stenotrophicus TaxID=266809 RepID=A0A0P1F090_9RHOB|nr:AAA family ATPase [Thalassobacter stenotrophicus]CUH60956.1 Regulatory protein RepA [Thalassobacter stenotrophicus]SHI53434.1 RecA-family ATPase [Thalassobacter stenotrophicus DSM 16310]
MQNQPSQTAAEMAARLIDNGYAPIPIPHGQKGPRIANWQHRTFQPTDFATNANIGIRCGDSGVAFCDIDVYCPDIAEAISFEWLRRFTASDCNWMQRTGQAPKTGYLFRYSELNVPVAKSAKIPTGMAPVSKDGKPKDEKVEILSKGQQFVAFGTHPETGKPYRWGAANNKLNPLDVFLGTCDALPALSSAEVANFLEWVSATYGQEREQQTLSGHATTAIRDPSAAGIYVDTGSGYHAATETTPEEALEIISWIDTDDYHTWIKVLGALHEKGDHMLSIAEDWSSKSGKYRTGEVAQKWRTFKPSKGNVWNSVCKMAEANGANLSAIATKHKTVASSAQDKSKDTANEVRSEGPDKFAEQINRFQSGIFRACDLEGQPVPERVWHVHDLIPANTVTLLSGDGGTGKSLCALQLAVSTTLQRPWLGLAVRHGKAVYLSAEDDKAELHRRLADITRAENATLADLGDLTLRSLAGEDALLATVAKGGTLQATPLLEAINQLLLDGCPDLLVLDTLADYFPGNENDRAQARQFIGMLRGLAINHRCAVIMLAHPSVAGMASGTGTSGSTGWNNSVRSRLYLSRVVQDGYEQNPDARVIRTMKSNYARTGAEITLKWQAGVFVADAPVTGLDRVAASAKAERLFLTFLRHAQEQGRRVNHSGGRTYAPAVFAEHPEAEGVTKRAFRQAMENLLASDKVKITEAGPPSKRRQFLMVAE